MSSSSSPTSSASAAGLELLGELRQRGVEPGAPAQLSMALKRPAETSQARGIGGHAIARPLLERRGEGVVQRLLGEIEVAEQADQGREDAARLGAVDSVDHLARVDSHWLCCCTSSDRSRIGPDLDGPKTQWWDARGELQGLVQIACLEQDEAGELLFGLRKRSIGHRDLAVPDAQRRGGVD